MLGESITVTDGFGGDLPSRITRRAPSTLGRLLFGGCEIRRRLPPRCALVALGLLGRSGAGVLREYTRQNRHCKYRGRWRTVEYTDFSASQLERLLSLVDSFKSVRPDRGGPFGEPLRLIRDLAVSGEPDSTMRFLAEWLVDVHPAIAERDRAFIVEMAEAFPAEDAVESLRGWQAT